MTQISQYLAASVFKTAATASADFRVRASLPQLFKIVNNHAPIHCWYPQRLRTEVVMIIHKSRFGTITQYQEVVVFNAPTPDTVCLPLLRVIVVGLCCVWGWYWLVLIPAAARTEENPGY
jgi:hypothetical protein